MGGVINALLWTGTAASAVNLSPTDLTGVQSSYAIDTDGTHQVGYGNGSSTGNHFHALLWSGTGASAVDLHPTALATLLDSQALGVGGGQEVGLGTTAGLLNHALFWTGSAASAVDLEPLTGFVSSQAQATNGKQQVGWGVTTNSGATHALLWNGTAASAVDLHDALPAGFSKSYASSIDANGDVFGLALDSSGNYHAIKWAVPEPSSLCLAILASPSILLRRRRVANS